MGVAGTAAVEGMFESVDAVTVSSICLQTNKSARYAVALLPVLQGMLRHVWLRTKHDHFMS